MSALLRNLRINKVALVDAGAGKGVRIELFKRRPGAEDDMTKTVKKGLDEVMAMIAALTPEEKAALMGELTKAAEPTEEEKAKKMAEEEAEKAVAKAKAEARSDVEKANAKAEALKKRLADIEKARTRDALLVRIEKSMRGLEGTPAEIADELLAVTDEAAREKLAKRFEETSASRLELLKKSGLMSELGTKLHGKVQDPKTEFDGEVAKAMETEKLKKSDAIAAIAKRRPDLYEAARKAGKEHAA